MNIPASKDSLTAIDIEEDRIGKEIVDAAFQVHKAFGPGLLESVYEACLAEELALRAFQVDAQRAVPVHYRSKKLDIGFKLDLLVQDLVIIEVKVVEKLLPVHEAQLLTYLKLSDKRLGYLVNFNSPLLKDGIKRMVRRN
jgi:GxxExxY protein